MPMNQDVDDITASELLVRRFSGHVISFTNSEEDENALLEFPSELDLQVVANELIVYYTSLKFKPEYCCPARNINFQLILHPRDQSILVCRAGVKQLFLQSI